MDSNTKLLLLVLLVHWFADFILQTRQMASNKSSSIKWLSIHILVYTLPLMLFGVLFAVVNGLCHWLTDYVTSRQTSRLYKENNIHAFFAVIGLDQLIHTATLILSLPLATLQL